MKNILLIGGSYGIGLAIAKELQYECKIFIAARTNELSSDLNITYIPFDATTDDFDTSKNTGRFRRISLLPREY